MRTCPCSHVAFTFLQDRFITVSRNDFANDKEMKFAATPRRLEMLKRGEFKRDEDMASTMNMTTEGRAANLLRAHYESKPLADRFHVGDVSMPDCRL